MDQDSSSEKLVAEFTLSGLPESINAMGRKHWSYKVKEIKKWKLLVQAACLKAQITALRLDRAILSFTRHSSVEPDSDNLVISFKAVLDGLVNCGVLIDDKPSIIGIPHYKWAKAPKGKGFITIRIERP